MQLLSLEPPKYATPHNVKCISHFWLQGGPPQLQAHMISITTELVVELLALVQYAATK